MALTAQTRKILWARSGNQCAKCQVALVAPAEAAKGKLAIVGQECHIVAKTPDGPRGSEQPNGDWDAYGNLILLCANCHVIVDRHPDLFPRDELLRIKRDHESRLAARDGDSFKFPKVRIEGSDSPPTLRRIDHGKALLDVFRSACVGSRRVPPVLSGEQRSLIVDFLDSFDGWNEAYEEVGWGRQLEAEHDLDDQLEALRDVGLFVFAGTKKCTMVAEGRDPVPWPHAILVVVHEEDARADSSEQVKQPV